MLFALIALQVVTLLALMVVLLRRPVAAVADPRMDQLLAADLPGKLLRLDARSDATEQHLRAELAGLRSSAADEAARTRETAASASTVLRSEVIGNIATLGETLRAGLDGFRGDNSKGAETLRVAVEAQLTTLAQRFTAFASDTARDQVESRDALHTRLNQLGSAQSEHQEKLRTTVEARLDKLNDSNAAKLEEMRATVDEKLHATLQTRLTESFGQVTDQLTKVHAGLGEMTKLSAGVDDLSRIFTNVKTRGTIGEVMLETLLKQMLAPSQYAQNARVKPNTQEMVEFAVKLPTPQGEMLLPIDSKFPREIWERLQAAYESGSDVVSAGKAFESAIRFEGKKICEKYIAPPHTTTFAIMFLPSEALYAEVMRRDGLQADIQQNCRVTIAGPSTLSAILNSFQMGFHMLQMQQKGDEVWRVLANARTQFGKFEDLMTKMDDQVSKVQKTIQDVGVRTRVINKALREVKLDDTEQETLGMSANNVLPMLAAEGED